MEKKVEVLDVGEVTRAWVPDSMCAGCCNSRGMVRGMRSERRSIGNGRFIDSRNIVCLYRSILMDEKVEQKGVDKFTSSEFKR